MEENIEASVCEFLVGWAPALIAIEIYVKIHLKVYFKNRICGGDGIMEKVVGVNKIRPKLGEYLKEAEKGEALIISSRSEPKGVLLSYARYNELKALAEKAKMTEISRILNQFRERAEKSGLSEADVQKEVEKVRNARSNRH